MRNGTPRSRGFAGISKEPAHWLGTRARDLTAVIPHGEGRTYLRQILLIADHNAYHLGQIVQTRKLLGAWGAKKAPAPEQ